MRGPAAPAAVSSPHDCAFTIEISPPREDAPDPAAPPDAGSLAGADYDFWVANLYRKGNREGGVDVFSSLHAESGRRAEQQRARQEQYDRERERISALEIGDCTFRPSTGRRPSGSEGPAEEVFGRLHSQGLRQQPPLPGPAVAECTFRPAIGEHTERLAAAARARAAERRAQHTAAPPQGPPEEAACTFAPAVNPFSDELVAARRDLRSPAWKRLSSPGSGRRRQPPPPPAEEGFFCPEISEAARRRRPREPDVFVRLYPAPHSPSGGGHAGEVPAPAGPPKQSVPAPAPAPTAAAVRAAPQQQQIGQGGKAAAELHVSSVVLDDDRSCPGSGGGPNPTSLCQAADSEPGSTERAGDGAYQSPPPTPPPLQLPPPAQRRRARSGSCPQAAAERPVLRNELLACVARDDAAGLDWLLRRCPAASRDAALRPPSGAEGPLLHVAAAVGAAGCIDTLLRLGADPNALAAADGSGARCAPLHLAAASGHGEAVSALLRDGRTDPLLFNEPGRSALHLACALGCLPAAAALISARPTAAHIDAQTPEGITPLMAASGALSRAARGRPSGSAQEVHPSEGACAGLLLRNGASAAVQDKQGRCALYYALRSDSTAAAGVLARAAAAEGGAALQRAAVLACLFDCRGVLEMLCPGAWDADFLAEVPRPDGSPAAAFSPIAACAAGRSEGCLQALLAAGAASSMLPDEQWSDPALREWWLAHDREGAAAAGAHPAGACTRVLWKLGAGATVPIALQACPRLSRGLLDPPPLPPHCGGWRSFASALPAALAVILAIVLSGSGGSPAAAVLLVLLIVLALPATVARCWLARDVALRSRRWQRAAAAPLPRKTVLVIASSCVRAFGLFLVSASAQHGIWTREAALGLLLALPHSTAETAFWLAAAAACAALLLLPLRPPPPKRQTELGHRGAAPRAPLPTPSPATAMALLWLCHGAAPWISYGLLRPLAQCATESAECSGGSGPFRALCGPLLCFWYAAGAAPPAALVSPLCPAALCVDFTGAVVAAAVAALCRDAAPAAAHASALAAGVSSLAAAAWARGGELRVGDAAPAASAWGALVLLGFAAGGSGASAGGATAALFVGWAGLATAASFWIYRGAGPVRCAPPALWGCCAAAQAEQRAQPDAGPASSAPAPPAQLALPHTAARGPAPAAGADGSLPRGAPPAGAAAAAAQQAPRCGALCSAP
eukprot:TRINITY_DN16927_c2_g1_i1.p1 TRINITY_DN16927_c2_g1~~TRINITY_DN16927_c2_g1_i1.p1  ORF type:complete len:1216 (+),score=262.89 TRINITY_DN16927_c2_g1_i1:66-3650(+)